MTTVVIMPGGFHPFHAGHAALYNSIRKAFPGAEVYVAATNDTSTRPFPFAVKEKLAQLAGVEPGHFVQVKSPFRAEEITGKFDPNKDTLIFVRSEKDATKPPQPGGTKKDGSPAYLQPFAGAKSLEPFARHAYMAYLPTVEFGPGMTSATEIRTAWPSLTDRRKDALVMSLYPRTQGNPKLAATVRKMLDTAIVGELAENQGWAAAYNESDLQTAGTPAVGGMWAGYQDRENQPVNEKAKSKPRDAELIKAMQYIKQHYPTYAGDPELGMAKWIQRSLKHSEEQDLLQNKKIVELTRKLEQMAQLVRQAKTAPVREDSDYIEEKWSEKYKRSIDCSNPKGFSQRAHCQGRKK